MRVPFIIYVNLECFLEKISTCRNNPNESSTIEINKHIPSGYSLLTYYLLKIHKIGLVITEVKTA